MGVIHPKGRILLCIEKPQGKQALHASTVWTRLVLEFVQDVIKHYTKSLC